MQQVQVLSHTRRLIIEGTGHWQAYGNQQRNAEILTNLLTNAHKFTPNEGTIVVQNSGASMTSAETGQLFAKFCRARLSAKEEDGTGMLHE